MRQHRCTSSPGRVSVFLRPTEKNVQADHRQKRFGFEKLAALTYARATASGSTQFFLGERTLQREG